MDQFWLILHNKWGRPKEKIKLPHGFGFFPGLEIDHERKSYFVTRVQYDFKNKIVRIHAKQPLINIKWFRL